VTADEIRAVALDVLGGIAPEADGLELAGALPLREQVDLDSMDLLNLVIGVHERLQVEVAEEDYDRCATLDGLVAVVQASLARPRG
jgi:acyl carrier protein